MMGLSAGGLFEVSKRGRGGAGWLPVGWLAISSGSSVSQTRLSGEMAVGGPGSGHGRR